MQTSIEKTDLFTSEYVSLILKFRQSFSKSTLLLYKKTLQGALDIRIWWNEYLS